MVYFPMFLNISGRKCLVVGGGKVALRKVLVLLDFDARVTVVARKISDEIRNLPVDICERDYAEEDIKACALVVAATDDANVNHKVAETAKRYHIPVNAVDQPEDCTFIFPAYVKRKNVVGAFSSAGNSPVLTQYLKAQIQDVLTDELGEINEYMGSIRDTVKVSLATETERKRAYRLVLEKLLMCNEAGQELQLSEPELQEILEQIATEHTR